MQKRRSKHSPTKRSTFTKITIAAILFLTITFGSFSALAADGKISSILSDWFSKKESEAISEIDDTISKAQKEETERLKTTLQEVLNNQKEELATFLEMEKQKRTDALEAYADELIEEFKLEQSNELEFDTSELDAIMEDAKEQMDAVTKEAGNTGEESFDSDSDSDEEEQEENSTEEDSEGESAQ